MMTAEAIGVPWSFTLHRWDIYANNLLAEKLQSAQFARVISQRGKMDTLAIAPGADDVRVLHLGVDLPSSRMPDSR